MTALFSPFQAGVLKLRHRIVLAPMSRYRCTGQMAPHSLTAEYYVQRASPGGLLITEATHINPEGTPVWNIYPEIRDHGGESPGIWTEEQTAAYRQVVDKVHARDRRPPFAVTMSMMQRHRYTSKSSKTTRLVFVVCPCPGPCWRTFVAYL